MVKVAADREVPTDGKYFDLPLYITPLRYLPPALSQGKGGCIDERNFKRQEMASLAFSWYHFLLEAYPFGTWLLQRLFPQDVSGLKRSMSLLPTFPGHGRTNPVPITRAFHSPRCRAPKTQQPTRSKWKKPTVCVAHGIHGCMRIHDATCVYFS